MDGKDLGFMKDHKLKLHWSHGSSESQANRMLDC